MSQRLTRREIKRDEFAEALERSASFVERNSRALVIAAVVVAVALLGAFGVWTWMKSQAQKGNAELAAALETYRAPVGADAVGSGDAETFPTSEARRARAEEKFTAVVDDYGMTDAADVARAYLGQLAVDQGDLDRARTLWQEYLDDHPDDLLSGEVRLDLLALDRQEGKGEQVLSELQTMLDAAPDDRQLPGDLVLWELGRTYEQMDRMQEAQDSYRRLTEEYPQSAFVSEARQKAGPAAAQPAAMPGIG